MAREGGPEPLHQSFISIHEDASRKNSKRESKKSENETGSATLEDMLARAPLMAESQPQSTEEYLASGRDQDRIQLETKRYLDRKESSQRKLLNDELKRAKQANSILGKLGTAVGLGIDPMRELTGRMDAFSDRIMDAYDHSVERMAAANERLFGATSPAPEASTEQRKQLAEAQRVHKLAADAETETKEKAA